jgi:site-specific DNA-methyltransferase (adenine-specific)
VLDKDPKVFQSCFEGKETLSRAKKLVENREKTAKMRFHAMCAKAVTGKPSSVEVVLGDCVKLMRDTDKPMGAALIVADPPYNIGVDYGGGKKSDQLSTDDYGLWCRAWVEECHRHLSPLGTLAIVINWENRDLLLRICQSFGLHHLQQITWFESFGVNCSKQFNLCSRPILWLTKDPEHFTFHADTFNRPSDRQAIHGDKRAVAGGKMWDDVWGINPPIPRLVGNAAERVPDFPTQLPEALIRPMVEGWSNPGDLVIDPFSGSGTTMACCLKSGRRGIGYEQSKTFAELSRLRLAAVKPDGEHKPRA